MSDKKPDIQCGSSGGQGIGAGHVCRCIREAGHPLDSDRPHGCPCGAVWRTRHQGHDVTEEAPEPADDTVTAKLAEWEALTEAATPGVWFPVDDNGVGDCTLPAWTVSRTAELGPYEGDIAYLPQSLTDRSQDGQRAADAAFIAAAREMVPALLGFAEDVRALHVSSFESRGVGRVDPETGEWGAYCDHDGEWWPCPTVQALTKRIGGEG